MRRQGIELVDEVEFTSAIRDLSAESFIRMLAERLNPKIIVAGFNYTFGKKKSRGTARHFKGFCQKNTESKRRLFNPCFWGASLFQAREFET